MIWLEMLVKVVEVVGAGLKTHKHMLILERRHGCVGATSAITPRRLLGAAQRTSFVALLTSKLRRACNFWRVYSVVYGGY